MREKLIKAYEWVAHKSLSCGADKWAHFTLSLIMAYLFGAASLWYWGFAITLGIGLLKEYAVDGWLRGGKADTGDLRADIRGAAAGTLLLIL